MAVPVRVAYQRLRVRAMESGVRMPLPRGIGVRALKGILNRFAFRSSTQSELDSDAGNHHAVDARRVSKRFGSALVLENIDLVVQRGEVVVIIGASGSGKTTLLRCIAGLETIESGEIMIFGHPVRRAWQSRGHIGFVFQQFNLFPHRTALGNVTLALRKTRRMRPGAAKQHALEALKQVGLLEKADAHPSKLSGGQQQRVAIARALAMEPYIMLFDEPTSALDRELVAEVLITMKRLAEQGMTMIVVTHELHFASRVADRVVFIDRGQIVEQGRPEQVLEHPQHPRTAQFLGAIAPDLGDEQIIDWEAKTEVAQPDEGLQRK